MPWLRSNRNAAPAKPRPSLRRRLAQLTATASLIAVVPFCALVFGGAFSSGAVADCIVVPGAAVKRGREPSDALRYRLQTALQLYQDRRAPRIIVTGGGQADYAEADVMQQWLRQRGVPAEAILRDDLAANTRESGRNVAQLMRRHELESALVCSQWFHTARTRLCLEQEGIRTHAAPCGGNTLIKEPLFVLREMAALPIYALRLDELRE